MSDRTKRHIDYHRGPAIIGAFTGVHLAAFAIVAAGIFFGIRTLSAQSSPFTPCFAREECLTNSTGAGSATPQPNKGICDNQHCWETGGGCPAGQGKCWVNPPPAHLAIAIGNSHTVLDLGDYIAKVYNYAVGVAAILAAIFLVIGGFQWLTAGSEAAKVSRAKTRIQSALIGLIMTIGAYAILQTINPDVLRLEMPKVSVVKRKLFIACQYFQLQKPCGQQFSLIRNTNVPDTAPIDQRYRLAPPGEAGGTICTGMSCSLAGHDDATERCRLPNGASPPEPTSSGSADSCISQPVAPYICSPCTMLGSDCRGSGPSTDCCSGYCVGGAIRSAMGGMGSLAGSAGLSGPAGVLTGVCGNGANGVQCGVDTDCFSHHCADTGGTGLGGQCVSGEIGSLCDADSDCNAGYTCVTKEGIHVCGMPQPYGPCEDNSDCPSGSSCGDDNRCDPHITGCNTDADCAMYAGQLSVTLHCWTDHDPHVCKTNGVGSVCHSDADCSDIPNGLGYCYDGAIQNASGIAGICVQSGPGSGCDPGGTGDTQCKKQNQYAVCRAIQSHFGNDGLCTNQGTAGLPCVGPSNNGGSDSVTNTCVPPLRCPQGVYVCVAPQGCGGAGGTH